MYKIHRGIASMNKMTADSAGTMHSIIKYEYNTNDGSVITVPIATLYKNDKDLQISYIPIDIVIFVPLYNNLMDENYFEEIKNIKSTFEDYINFIYSTYNDVIDSIYKSNKSLIDENAPISENLENVISTLDENAPISENLENVISTLDENAPIN